MAGRKENHPDDAPPLHLEDAAVVGQIEEEDAQRERFEAFDRLHATLRAILAERIVRDPEEEIRQADIVRDVRARVENSRNDGRSPSSPTT